MMALKAHFALLAFPFVHFLYITAPFNIISVHLSKTGARFSNIVFSEVSVQFSKINTFLVSISPHFSNVSAYFSLIAEPF